MEATARPLPEPPAADARTAHGSVAPGPSAARILVGLGLALALLAVGLVVGRHLLHDEHATRTDFRHLIEGLGDGWRPVAAKDEGADTGPPFPGAHTILLGTHDDPTAPAMELAWRVDDAAPTYDNLAASSGMEQLPTSGRAAACAPQQDGTTLCYADEGDRGLQLRARGVANPDISTVVDAVTFADGHPTVDAAALPAGLDVLVDGRNAGLGLVANGNADHPSVASVLYAGPGGETALLVVGDAGRQELAYGGVFVRWERASVDGRDVYVSAGGDGVSATWVDGAHAFWLRSSVDDVSALLGLVTSVRPAEVAEWEAIPPRPQWDGPPIVTG